MSDLAYETPLLELVRSVPKDLRAEWESQWFGDGTPCGHSMAPVGNWMHRLADEIERLEAEKAELSNLITFLQIENGELRQALNEVDDEEGEEPGGSLTW